VSKSSNWLISLHVNLINPSHILNIQNWNIFIVCLVLDIWRAIIPTEEDKQHFIQDTRLFFFLLWIFSRNMGNCNPLLLWNVEGIIILQYVFVVASEDDDLISISHHILESSAFRQCFFNSRGSQLGAYFC
jgi:hypothetical protein